MASITKRGGSYLIKVSCGYNCKGKQMVQTMTWKPERSMTQNQIEKRSTDRRSYLKKPAIRDIRVRQ